MQEAPSVLPNTRAATEGPFDLLARWQRYLDVSGRASPNTRAQYRRYMVAFLADTLIDPRDVTEEDVVDYLASRPPKAPMRGVTLRALRSFYTWCEDRAICPNPVKRLRVPKVRYGAAASLSPEELEAVLRAAEGIDPRARPAIELMYATGARLGSLCALTADDVRGGICRFRVAKYDAPYAVPLSRRGEAAVARLLGLASYTPVTVRERRPTLVGVGGYSVWRWCRLAGEAAGVRCYPHLLRHTFATRLAQDPSVALIDWVTLMNHRDGSLLRRYAASSGDERLRAAVEPL